MDVILLNFPLHLVCSSSGYTAAHWNVPLLPYSCVDEGLSYKSDYPTMVRIGAPLNKMGPALAEIIMKFGWDTVVVFHNL